MSSSGGDDLENERGGMTASGTYIVDTAPVRRDKGVVSATFEVVIGTRDSERRKGKQKEEETPTIPEEPVVEPAPHDESTTVGAERPYANYPTEDDYWGYDYHDWSHHNGNGHEHWEYYENGWDHPPAVPMPHVPDDSQLTEKERVQRAEQRLLPSQPPGLENESGESSHAATAPHLPGEEVPGLYGASIPAYGSLIASPPGPPNAAVHTPHSDMSAPVPGYFPAAGPSNHVSVATPVDDKQEMQRRELEAEASAPPIDDEDLYTNSDGPWNGIVAVPQASAPALPFVPEHRSLSPDGDGDATLVPNESDMNHDSHTEAAEEPDLPRYEPQSLAPEVESQHQQPDSQASQESTTAHNTPKPTEGTEANTTTHDSSRDA